MYLLVGFFWPTICWAANRMAYAVEEMSFSLNVAQQPASHKQPAAAAVFPEALPRDSIRALYVHVPFCFHKCHYCDFYSITRQTPERMGRFVDLLLREAALWRGSEVTIETVFFGGGTPSLLAEEQMERLLVGLGRVFDLSRISEWTVECNPATVDEGYLRMLRGLGVDRLSFGAQSFDPAELATLERHHDPADVRRSLELARACGFERLNVDLIFGIPGQTLAAWARNLEVALELGVDHLSCYALTYEPNTPMAVKRRLGSVLAVEESVEIDMLRHTRRRLREVGLGAYEISNYARDGQECRHNLAYWRAENYIGLGPSAASHVGGYRWKNRPHLREWELAIEGGSVPADELERLEPLHRAAELAYLMLRTRDGISAAEFGAGTGFELAAAFAGPIARLIYGRVVQWEGGRLKLTERGVELADAAGAEMLSVIG